MGHPWFYLTFSLLYLQHGTGCHACGWCAGHANSLLHLLVKAEIGDVISAYITKPYQTHCTNIDTF